MNLLDHMRTFVFVARLSSFSAAAKALNLSLPSVSRSISRLEGHLNAALLNRTTRHVQLTQVGRDFLNRCSAIIVSVDEALRAIADSNISPEGHLRVHASSEIGKRYLIPAIADYRRTHPLVTFDLVLEDRAPDILTEDFDVAVSLIPQSDDRLISRNVGATYSVLCASKDYLLRHGEPHVPAELTKHQCLTPGETPIETTDTWLFEGPYGPVNVYIPPSSVQLNCSDAIVDAVCAGLGIGCIPVFTARPLLDEGRLVSVLPRYRLASQGIHAFYPERHNENICVRSWLAHISICLPKLLAGAVNELPLGVAKRKIPAGIARPNDHHPYLG